jgi:hypothetical protein
MGSERWISERPHEAALFVRGAFYSAPTACRNRNYSSVRVVAAGERGKASEPNGARRRQQ